METKPVFQVRGPRVGLGPVDESCVAPCTAWLNDLSTGVKLGQAHLTYTEAAERKFLLENSPSQHLFALRLAEGPLIGTAALFDVNHLHRRATLGILIGEPTARGRGLGTEAVQLVTAYGFQVLNLHNIDLSVFSFHAAALACYQKAGYREYGRRKESYWADGRAWDQVLLQALAPNYPFRLDLGLA